MITTDYARNFIYKDTGSGPILQFYNHPEGYVEPDGSGGYDYVYQYKDHLGNVRLSCSDGNGNGIINVSTEILEENNYYPFGLKHQGYNVVVNSTNPALKMKFGGKELDESLDLNTYDFGARNYDAAIGRWMNVDPKAYKYFSYSPYNYAINSPLIYVDPNGEELYVAGNRKERRQLYREIKKLTKNRLKLNRKTGEVTIRNGRANNGKDLRRGTELLTSIISKKDQRVTTITRENANENFGLTGSGNQTIKGHDSNSIGEGNAVVVIDLNDTGDGVTNEDGSTGRPLFIGVAHELIHGDRIINGREEEGTNLSNYFIDPDTPELPPGGDPTFFHDEEMNVREIENLIRDENKIIKRASPIFVNPNKDLDEFLKKINNRGN